MADISPYPFTNPLDGVAKGFSLGNALRQNSAEQAAGAQLQAGNYGGASNALYGAGDLQGGFAVVNAGQAQADRIKQKGDAQKQAVFQATGDIADHLAYVAQRSQKPEDVLTTWDTLAPRLRQLGESDADIAQVRQSLMTNPAVTIASLRSGVEKELGPQKPVELDPTKNYYMPNTGFEGSTAPSPAPPPPPTPPDPNGPSIQRVAPTSTSVSPDAVWRSIKTQESGGEASPGTAVGPDTPYGNALGSTQMLPATAEAMARKVGVPWNPAYMRENSPQALAYQDKLGRAYFDQGTEAGGGDPAAGAAYYFGGPDPALHGPKTRAYVKAVMARAGAPQAGDQGAGSVEGGAGADAIPPPPVIPGMHLIQTGQAKDKTKDAPSGYRWAAGGHLEAIPGGPADDDAPLTENAITMGATRYAMTGVMPQLGMGKAARADRTKIQNKASDLIDQWGVKPEDWVTGVAQFKIAQGSLGQISKTRNMVQASEGAVVANMNNVVMPLLNKVKPGGVPFLNKYEMAIRDRAFGDPDVKAYDNALHTVADEYSKVMTTTTGAGGQGTSDSARAEAYRRLSSSQTAAQLQASFSALESEMANRRQALQAQEAALTDQLRHGLSTAPNGAGSPAISAPSATPANRPPLSSFQK